VATPNPTLPEASPKLNHPVVKPKVLHCEARLEQQILLVLNLKLTPFVLRLKRKRRVPKPELKRRREPRPEARLPVAKPKPKYPAVKPRARHREPKPQKLGLKLKRHAPKLGTMPRVLRAEPKIKRQPRQKPTRGSVRQKRHALNLQELKRLAAIHRELRLSAPSPKPKLQERRFRKQKHRNQQSHNANQKRHALKPKQKPPKLRPEEKRLAPNPERNLHEPNHLVLRPELKVNPRQHAPKLGVKLLVVRFLGQKHSDPKLHELNPKPRLHVTK
jgi:hypothetical protein